MNTRIYKIFLLLLAGFLSSVHPIMAQKKEIIEAKSQIKSGKNLVKAENSMRKLLLDSSNKNNTKIWLTLYMAVRKQYESGNERLYLKQKCDTDSLFDNTLKLFQILESFDSIDATPDKKGMSHPEYREKHAEFLNQIRPNLFNGGAFFIKKQKYDHAYQFFNQYVNGANQPLFRSYKYAEKDKNMPQAAYWAAYCGYKQQNAKETLHHAYWALKDTTHYLYMLQYLAETYKLEKDTTRYLEALKDGFSKSPTFPFFFPRLVDYYANVEGNNAKALAVADSALAKDPKNIIFQFAKSTILLNTGRFEECIAMSDKLIAENDSLSDAYYNAGLAYYDRAVEIDKGDNRIQHNRKSILSDYRKALPYLEKYRKLAPDQESRWAVPLYTIYLNLNMGKEFDEMDKILRK